MFKCCFSSPEIGCFHLNIRVFSPNFVYFHAQMIKFHLKRADFVPQNEDFSDLQTGREPGGVPDLRMGGCNPRKKSDLILTIKLFSPKIRGVAPLFVPKSGFFIPNWVFFPCQIKGLKLQDFIPKSIPFLCFKCGFCAFKL